MGSNPIGGAWKTARYANRQSGQAQTLPNLWVRFPPVLLRNASAGHLASLSGCNPPAFTAVQVQLLPGALEHGPFVYRCRTPVSRTGKMGSIPIRATRLSPSGGSWQTHGAQNAAPHRHGSSNLPLATLFVQAGRCSTGPHKAGWPGSIPGPATEAGSVQRDDYCLPTACCLPLTEMAGYANRQSGHLERVVIDCGFDSHPGY